MDHVSLALFLFRSSGPPPKAFSHVVSEMQQRMTAKSLLILSGKMASLEGS